MSIGIYAFLRIYFLGFGLSAFAQFRTHSTPSSTQPPSRSAQRGLSGIECRPVQRVQRPGVCVGAWRGLPCIWHGLPCCPCCAVCPGALGLGSPPAGYTGRAGGGVVDTSRRKNSKKAFSLLTHPLFSAQNALPSIFNLKNSEQK